MAFTDIRTPEAHAAVLGEAVIDPHTNEIEYSAAHNAAAQMHGWEAHKIATTEAFTLQEGYYQAALVAALAGDVPYTSALSPYALAGAVPPIGPGKHLVLHSALTPWVTFEDIELPATSAQVFDYIVKAYGYLDGTPTTRVTETATLRVTRDGSGNASLLSVASPFADSRLRVTVGTDDITIDVRAHATEDWIWDTEAIRSTQDRSISVTLEDGTVVAVSGIRANRGAIAGVLDLDSGPLSLVQPDDLAVLGSPFSLLLGDHLKGDDASFESPGATFGLVDAASVGALDRVANYPDSTGALNATLLRPTSANSGHSLLVYPDLVSGNGPHILEYFVKASGYNRIRLQAILIGGVWHLYQVGVNLDTGELINDGSTHITNSITGYPLVVSRCPNGWWRVAMTFLPQSGATNVYQIEVGNNSGGGDSYSFAGNESSGVLIEGPYLRRIRQTNALPSWNQTTDSKCPVIFPFLCPAKSPSILAEGCGSGTFEAKAISATDWGGTAPLTIHLLGRLLTETVPAADGCVVRLRDTAGTNYLEIGYRNVASAPYLYARQVVAGGNDISAVSTLRASHVPVCRSLVFGANTVQFYADGEFDGAAKAFVFQAFTPTVIEVGNVSGDWTHALSRHSITNASRNQSQVQADATALMAGIGLPLGPWEIIALFGQSNSMRRGGGTKLRQLIGPDFTIPVPCCFAHENLNPPGTQTIASNGFIPIGSFPIHGASRLIDDDSLATWGLEYMMARLLHRADPRRKLVVVQYGMGGAGWTNWAPSVAGPMFAPWIARLQAKQTLIAVPSRVSYAVSSLGEGECGPGVTANIMETLVRSTISGLRTSLADSAIKSIILRMGNWQRALAPYTDVVNAGFEQYAATDPLCRTVDADNVLGFGDGIHSTHEAMVELGTRLGQSVLSF
jgi:hypothetical protein